MSGPLRGVRVVVTRPEGQAEGLIRGFREVGAEVEWLGLLEVVPKKSTELERACRDMERFRWVAITSANAVAPLFDLLPEGLPSSVAVAVVGEATGRALRGRGVKPRLVSATGSGEGLARELAAREDLAGARVLLPLAGDARRELAEGLRAAGAEVTEVVAYEKRRAAGAGPRTAALFPAGAPLGWVTFTSPRLARTFAEMIDRHAGGWETRHPTLLAASIGPTTSAELRRLGVEPAAEAAAPGDEALVAAVVAAADG